MFKITTKTIVATGLGAALFMVLFMYVKVPSPVPETSFQTAYGISAFFAALFGPIAGALIAFIGHALSDFLQYGSPWWSWIVASGVSGFGCGLFFTRHRVNEGEFNAKTCVAFNLVQALSHLVAWLIVAPVLDIVIYAEPANLVFAQGVIATIMNIVSTAIIGTLLLFAYSKTRTKEGSLTKQ